MKWTKDDCTVQLIGMAINDDGEATATLRCVENGIIALYDLELEELMISRCDSKAEFVYGHHVVAIMAHLGELRDVAEEHFGCSFEPRDFEAAGKGANNHG